MYGSPCNCDFCGRPSSPAEPVAEIVDDFIDPETGYQEVIRACYSCGRRHLDGVEATPLPPLQEEAA